MRHESEQKRGVEAAEAVVLHAQESLRSAGSNRRALGVPAWAKKIPAGSPEKDYVQHAPAWMQGYMHKYQIPSDPDLHAAKMLANKVMQPIVVDLLDKFLTNFESAHKMYQESQDFFSGLVKYRMELQQQDQDPGQGATDAMRHGHALWSAVNQAAQSVGHLKRDGMKSLYPWMRKGLKALGWGEHGEKAKKAAVTAMEHPSERDKQQYLREHPNADPSKHTVAPHDSPRRDRVQDEPHSSGTETIHESHAPATVKKFLTMKLPAVTNQNRDRIMSDPKVRSVVQDATKMSDEEFSKARADAQKYMESLDKRAKDIEKAGGKSPGFEKAKNHAHAVWYVLSQVAAQRAKGSKKAGTDLLGWLGEKQASLYEDPLATPMEERAGKEARSPEEWAQFDKNHAQILDFFRHLRWDVRPSPQGVQLTAPNQQFRAWLRVGGDVHWKYGPDLTYGPNTMMLHGFNIDSGTGEQLYKALKKDLGTAQGMRMIRIAQDPIVALEQLAKFEEGKPADPTQDMSEEDAKEWRRQHDLHKDEFKAATDEVARFEEGKPADPTQDMSEEDAKEWRRQHDLHKDEFKGRDAAESFRRFAEDPGFNLKPLERMAELLEPLPKGFQSLHTSFDQAVKSLLGSKVPSDKKLAEIARSAETAIVDAIHAGDKLKRAVRDPAHRMAGAEDPQIPQEHTAASPMAMLERMSRFEEGKSADPTENMSEADAKKWWDMHAKYKDKFKTAGAPQGLYGYTKAVQADCEVAARRLDRAADRIARRAHAADPRVGAFFAARAERRGCEASKILGEALRAAGSLPARAAAGSGMYGMRDRTALLGLRACAELEASAGRIAADLFSRRVEARERLAAFLRDHSRRARCMRSRLLAACAPAVED